MIGYIKAEIFRILSKKSLYLCWLALLAAFAVMMAIQYGGRVPMAESSIIMQGKTLFSLMMAIVGGCFLFFTVYTDDLGAKTLPALIGFGKKRSGIVFSKLIVMTLFTVAMFVLTLFAFLWLFSAMGYAVGGGVTEAMWKLVLEKTLTVVAFAAISSVVVYGTQKTALSVVLFAMLSTGFVSQLLINFLDSSLMQGVAGGLSRYTIMPIIETAMADTTFAAFLPYAIYLGVFVTLSIVAFDRKELEF